MLSGNCTEALSIQATVTISGSIAKDINNGIAPLPFPLPALLMQYWYKARGEGQGEGRSSILCNIRVYLRFNYRFRILFRRDAKDSRRSTGNIVRVVAGRHY